MGLEQRFKYSTISTKEISCLSCNVKGPQTSLLYLPLFGKNLKARKGIQQKAPEMSDKVLLSLITPPTFQGSVIRLSNTGPYYAMLFVHLSWTSTQRIHVLWTAADFLWVGRLLDMQTATNSLEIGSKCLCLANLSKARSKALKTIQTKPQTSPIHLRMLLGIGILETKLSCT